MHVQCHPVWGQAGSWAGNMFVERCSYWRRGLHVGIYRYLLLTAIVKWWKESTAITFGAKFHRRQRKKLSDPMPWFYSTERLPSTLCFSGGWMDMLPSQVPSFHASVKQLEGGGQG